ncbi:phosphotransferase enzyme family protein [Streptomyces ipomoeae]|uniref:phosphotransferase enzyme family protein n=1 Tax=Streptomyces ipomoeae TaxID=103232 RepID=UPI0011463317|nr:phosphotransferase [Streptomyces ipomoeae]MDX2938371.1 phosphotransferase [Streptomyces ipomoeae]TQE22073.1 aminoglycoside phosphotransferase family protein [Streptomyces ipomoeae]
MSGSELGHEITDLPRGSDLSEEPRPGSAAWVTRIVETQWGVPPASAVLRPLASASGERLLSHTSGLWRIDLPWGPGGEQAAFVFKAQLNAAAIRPPEFHELKRRIMDICAGHGIPVPAAVPAVDGSVVVRQGGVDCELTPMLPGTARRSLTPAQASGVATTGLALRSVLDHLPDNMVTALQPYPVNPLVEEERWQVALDDALGRLLPLAGHRTDEWGRLIAPVLRQLQRCKPLLDRFAAMEADAARDASVVHGDLHRHHFLFDDDREDRVTAVLDFDNLRLGDRLLDLAWIAGTVGRVAGTWAVRQRSTAAFVRAAEGSGLLAPGEARLLMPTLLAYAVPVVVDIAKDILERNILDDLWIEYLDLLSPARMAETHTLLTGRPPGPPPASRPSALPAHGL